MNILFFGSSDYCLPVLESLHKNFKLTAIITRPDKEIGRNKILTPSPPKKFGLSHHIPVFTPKTASEISKLIPELNKCSPDLSIVADYGLMIPDDIITLAKIDILNIHLSRLPKYRGPSPVQHTILNGEKSAWIYVIKLVKKLDAGEIIYQKEISLSGDETTESLYKKLFNIASVELPAVLSDFALNKIKPIKQDESQATYTRKITKEDGFIPWELLKCALLNLTPDNKLFSSWRLIDQIPSLEIRNLKLEISKALRAFIPWPGVWTEITFRKIPGIKSPKFRESTKKRLKILKAHLENEKLVLDEVQLEGKNPVSWKQFRDGYSVDY
ncbi:methionyl-tRNA formyltransferase [Candidatus Gottesmanbacteria bacterium]|nr:methionyl-tRNA formyltransferase [Candidatus Gottesmanbacteria bacterium]